LVLILLAGVASVIIIFLTTRSMTVSDPIYAVRDDSTQAISTVSLNSPVVVQGNVVAGLKTFRQQCQACHPSLGKVAGVGPNLTNSPNAGDPKYIRNNVRNGKSPMPSFPSNQISDTDLENLVAYIASIRTK
jgi:mono/diheme cytochrome c family protein